MGVCFDQIFNQAAKFRYMFGGKAVTPLTIRTMYGAGFRAASQHSQCLYPLFTHIPGPEGGAAVQPLRGQGPADPVDPRRRPGHLLRAQGPLRHGGRGAGRGLCHPLRPGQRHPRGRRRHHRRLRPHGEPRQRAPPTRSPRRASPAPWSTRAPPRRSTPRRSWRRSRRPAASSSSTRPIRAAPWRPTSSALVTENIFGSLKAAPKTVTSPHAPVPFSPALEDLYIPSQAKIEAAVRAVMDSEKREGRGVDGGHPGRAKRDPGSSSAHANGPRSRMRLSRAPG